MNPLFHEYFNVEHVKIMMKLINPKGQNVRLIPLLVFMWSMSGHILFWKK